jgi:hypothetical protein
MRLTFQVFILAFVVQEMLLYKDVNQFKSWSGPLFAFALLFILVRELWTSWATIIEKKLPMFLTIALLGGMSLAHWLRA